LLYAKADRGHQTLTYQLGPQFSPPSQRDNATVPF